MLISYERKFIFIHVYKVAGSSVRDALAPYAYKPLLPVHFIRKHFKIELPHHRLRSFPPHVRAAKVQQALPARIYDNFFKFAFVRNPWDWQVSLYHFMRDYDKHYQADLVRRMSFEEYLNWRVNENLHLQQSFVTDASGKQIVDYIGRFERLSQDFAAICTRIGVPQPMLEHKRKSNHKDYRSYYTDRSAALIEQHYKADIDYFGYSFDGIAQLQPS